MSRKGKTRTRTVEGDPIYGHKLVTKLINRVLKDGKKTVAEAQVYGAFSRIENETKEDPLKLFLSAVENIKPTMEVRPRRVGGAAYQVPMPVRGSRRESLAIRWLIQAAERLPNSQYHTFAEKLAVEIQESARGGGGGVAKRKEIERVAEANRAFSHFRW